MSQCTVSPAVFLATRPAPVNEARPAEDLRSARLQFVAKAKYIQVYL